METVPLQIGLLNLIIMVQEHYRLMRSKSMFNDKHGLEEVYTWQETKRFYNSID